MNFIAGFMLYHSNEEIAFWLFVGLIESFELREIYEPGLPGMYKHSYAIDQLILLKLPDLHRHFH